MPNCVPKRVSVVGMPRIVLPNVPVALAYELYDVDEPTALVQAPSTP